MGGHIRPFVAGFAAMMMAAASVALVINGAHIGGVDAEPMPSRPEPKWIELNRHAAPVGVTPSYSVISARADVMSVDYGLTEEQCLAAVDRALEFWRLGSKTVAVVCARDGDAHYYYRQNTPERAVLRAPGIDSEYRAEYGRLAVANLERR
jgi:hypothetical protein